MQEEVDRLAGSLSARLATVSFLDKDADSVTELLIHAILEWGAAQGWRVYRRARSVVPIPYGGSFSTVDVGMAREGAGPIVVEVDRSDRQRTLDKLAAEAQAGRVALWVRWGTGTFADPPAPVRRVEVQVVERRGPHGRRLFSTLDHQLQPPEHSGVDLTTSEQSDLFE